MRVWKIILCVLMFQFLGTGLLNAQVMETPDANTDYEEVFMPQLFATSVTIDNDDEYPKEPNIQAVDFLKLPTVSSLDERVERMLHGITVDVPPEYDHYGYEIRRYMTSVGNPDIHKDGKDDFLIEQIKNSRKAGVIAKYWKEYLENEIEEMAPLVDDAGVSFATKTTYKQNTVVVRTFLISLRAWIDANERLLMNVFDHPGIYDMYYPEVIFLKPNLRIEYFNIATTRAQKLKDIRAYHPFAMMVY